MKITVRREATADIGRIHEITAAAFRAAPHSDHSEQFIVEALRDSGALSASIVAEAAGVVVGHVALSPVSISDGSQSWYGLGPISVEPRAQGKGVGSSLMNAALEELKRLNAGGCVLLGDPEYYRRFGFAPLEGLTLPDVPAEYFQAILLQGAQPTGEVAYHASFSAKSQPVPESGAPGRPITEQDG